MLRNYFLLSLRGIFRDKMQSAITIGGLVLGLTAFFAVFLYTHDELSYDSHHEKKDRIYRAIITAETDGQTNKWSSVPNKVGPIAALEIPEIEKTARLFHHNFGDIAFLTVEENTFAERKLFYADPELLDIFTIPFIKGNPSKALVEPNSIIISERAALQYFGAEDPIGKTILVDNNTSFAVTGVFQDFPSNSTIQCNLIASFSTHSFGNPKNYTWGNASFETYFLSQPNVQQSTIDKKIEAVLSRHIEKENRWYRISTQPLLDIRLLSGDLTKSYESKTYGSQEELIILMAMAVAILVISCINYTNYTTAQSQRRNKEVGIAKLLGATFFHLLKRFYTETAIFILLAIAASYFALLLLLPSFNQLTGKSITIGQLFSVEFGVLTLTIWVVLTLLAGIYPAIYLSSIATKNNLQKSSNAFSNLLVRKGLVIAQFSASIILIVSAIAFYLQMEFIRNRNLGYNPNHVVAVMTNAAKTREQLLALKIEFEKLAGVEKVARSQSFPGTATSVYSLRKNESDQNGISILTSRATSEVIDVLNLNLISGKSLPEMKNPSDTISEVILNKSAIDYLGLSAEEAIGKRVKIFDEGVSEIVGVVSDFHYSSLHQKIGPYAFHNARNAGYTYLLVKINSQTVLSTMEKMEETFKNIVPAYFEYTFLDQHLSTLYQSESKLTTFVTLLAIISICIACFGLYALAVYLTEQRTREIAIRKVLGANHWQLLQKIILEFLILIFISIIIGLTLSAFLKENWLVQFAYRATLGMNIYLVSGSVIILLALGTVSYQVLKAALRNPTESLRRE
ncbi:MAG: ABC transporter permease [Cyclobacteriaceae bacterium]|nr:ABC transporter permease [Cyclobacteriaceae bacterium]